MAVLIATLSGGGTDRIVLPAEAAPNDTIIFAAIGGFTGQGGAMAQVPDARMSLVHPEANLPMGGRDTGIWYGRVGELARPLEVHVHGTENSPIGQFSSWVLMIWRGFRVVASEFRSSSPQGEPGGQGRIPAFPATGPGRVMAVGFQSGGIGGAYVYRWDPPLEGVGGGDSSYVITPIAVYRYPGGTPELGPTTVDGNNYWRASLFDYVDTDLLPVRQYPREDGVGLSSASRTHPGPKSRGRIHGGYE